MVNDTGLKLTKEHSTIHYSSRFPMLSQPLFLVDARFQYGYHGLYVSD